MRRWLHAMLTPLFLAGISVPCVGTIFHWDTGGFTPWPKISKVKLAKLPTRLERWFNDNFGLRTTFVETHSRLQLGIFGDSTSKQVIIGKDNWLFYNADRILEIRRGLVPFTEAELIHWQACLEDRRDWLASQNIQYVFIVPPEKSTVYPEYLPSTQTNERENASRLDQFVAWMRQHSTVDVLDLRESLLPAKADDRLYHRTDTHWNDAGAFVACRQIAEWLKTKFPEVQLTDRSELNREVHRLPAGDLSMMLGLQRVLEEDRISLPFQKEVPPTIGAPAEAIKLHKWGPLKEPLVHESASGVIPRALVIRDSFFTGLVPYFSPLCKRVTYVWDGFSPHFIVDEKPQIVIEERVERYFAPQFPPINSPPVMGFAAKNRSRIEHIGSSGKKEPPR